jgi:ATP-binding cassette subfamily B protein
MVYRTQPAYIVSILVFRLIQALVPVSLLWIGKLIIEAVELYYRSGQPVDWPHLWTLVAIELGIAVAADAISRGTNLAEGLLGELFNNQVSVQIMEHAAKLDVAQFEDPDTYDQLERARQQTYNGIGFLHQILGLLQSIITLLSLVTALVIYVPWLIALLVVTVLPAFFGETHFATLGYLLRHRWTQSRRMLDYLKYIAANDASAKEVKLFGLSPYLVGRYRESAEQFLLENKRLAVKRTAVGILLATVGSLGLYGGYAVIIYYTIIGHQTPAGVFTIGVLTFLMGSFRQSRGLIQQVLLTLSQIYGQSLYIRDLFLFFEIQPRVYSKPDAAAVPKPIAHGFVFDGVSFKYPGSNVFAVRDLHFELHPNESVALVGENGAGKTTIVKLLTRLYDPDEGRVLLDGVDLREYALDELRANVGVIFQDFIRYSFLFKENIGVGQVDQIGDMDRVRSAAARSLADTVAGSLEDGFDQQLGRRFKGGIDLSGGEWQKVALARAYMREAQMLILDEPTASLDARSEYEAFQRFAELTRGRLTVLISHRFSTVRMADRILVLQKGRLLEQGTHQELLEGRGLYAELFNFQADGYR